MTLESKAETVSRFSRILANEEIREEVNAIFRSRWGGEPAEIRIRAIRVHGNRCTFEISGKTETGWRGVIGKLHTADRSDIFAAMKSIFQSGFGAEADFGVAEPLGYVRRFALLLEEKVEGVQAKEAFIIADVIERRAIAERCAEWLAKFHRFAPRAGAFHGPQELLVFPRHWTLQVKTLARGLDAKCETLLRKLEEAARERLNFEACAGHGSYIPSHVMLNGARTVIIDLDEHDLADPRRDLAWFVVSLERLGLKEFGSLRFYDDAIKRFLDAYTAKAGEEILEGLSFYRAMEYMHRARRDVYKRSPPDPERAETMLDEGLRTL